MAYLDIIPLATAKEYLKVDAGFTADDNQITRMIRSALRKIENITGHVADQRDKTYLVRDSEAMVFDYPIVAVVDPASGVEEVKSYTHSTFCFDDPDVEELTLTVGYTDSTLYPDELIDAALEMIDVMYYANSKEGKKEISYLAKSSINENKRFFI